MREAGLTVTNFDNSETVLTYPYPILRCAVTHPDGHNYDKVYAKCRSYSSDGEKPEEEEERTVTFETAWPVVKRCFRGVVCLQPGCNKITLSAFIPHCDTTLHLTLLLHYVPVRNPARFVLPVYIVCSDSDGSFQAESDEDSSLQSAVRRIATGAGLLQSATADSLVLEGFARKTFHLALDKAGLPLCQIFRTRLKTQEVYAMEEEMLWRFLKRELKEGFQLQYGDGCKFLAFLAATRFELPENEEPPLLYEDLLKFVKGHVALGGSNLALYGTGCLYTWPETLKELERRLLDGRLVNRRAFLDDSAYRGRRWACFSTTLGAAWHELGHTFDLGHVKVGIMARGFEDIYELFTAVKPPVEHPSQPIYASVGVIQKSSNTHRTSAHSLMTDREPSQISATSTDTSFRQNPNLSPPDAFVASRSTTKPNRLSSNSVRVHFAPHLDIRRAPSSASYTVMDTANLKHEQSVVVPDRKESRSFTAKVSGKLFGGKKKKMSEEVVDGAVYAIPSSRSARTVPEDVSSISSSCAISLSEPDSSAVAGDNSSISAFSTCTRPSSITSATKSARSWSKRFSFGGHEQQSFSTSTQPAPSFSHSQASAEKSNKSVVIKSYSMERYNTGPVPHHRLEQPAVTSPQAETVSSLPFAVTDLPVVTDGGYSENKVKMPWSRLFSKKKNKNEKDRLTPNVECAESEERHLPSIPSDQEINLIEPMKGTNHAAVQVINHSTPAANTDSETLIVIKSLVKKEVQSSESSNDPCSPDSLADSMEDSLEDFQFNFHKEPPIRYIATSVTQDMLGEIGYIQTQDELQSPVVEDTEGQSSGVSSATPEPVYLDELRLRVSQRLQQVRQLQMSNDPIDKPKPQLRARNIKEEKDTKQRTTVGSTKTNGIILREPVGKMAVTSSTNQTARVLSSAKPQVNSLTRNKQQGAKEKSEDVAGREEPLEKPASAVLSKRDPLEDGNEIKNTTLTRGRRGSQPTETLISPSHIQATRSKSVPKPSTKNSVVPVPPTATTTASTESKLRYPLRTQAAKKSSEIKDGNIQYSNKPQQDVSSSRTTLNKIPSQSTQSTQSSRNKVAKNMDKKATETTKPAKKSVVLTNTPISRQTVNRHSSRKKRSTKKAATKPSQRMDFLHMPVSHGQSTLRYCRSASRDSITGSLGDFMMSEAGDREREEVEVEAAKELESVSEDGLRTGVGSLQRKQHFSSLINTPSGISVMEEDVPHRLPLPLPPPSFKKKVDGKGVASSGGPKWTKDCASILNYHKWFNDDTSTTGGDTPEKLPRLAGRLLWSEIGLRVIELRNPCGEVLQHWDFTDQEPCKSFKLPIHISTTSEKSSVSKLTVVAIDANGNLLNRTVRGEFYTV